MNKEKALEAFEELKNDTKTIVNSSTLTSWKNKAINIVRRVYRTDNSQEKQISKFIYYPPFSDGHTDNISTLKGQSFALFEGFSRQKEF